MLSKSEKQYVQGIINNEGFWYGLTQYSSFRGEVEDKEFLNLVQRLRLISNEIEATAPDFVEELNKEGGFQDVIDDPNTYVDAFPELEVEIDRLDKCADALKAIIY